MMPFLCVACTSLHAISTNCFMLLNVWLEQSCDENDNFRNELEKYHFELMQYLFIVNISLRRSCEGSQARSKARDSRSLPAVVRRFKSGPSHYHLARITLCALEMPSESLRDIFHRKQDLRILRHTLCVLDILQIDFFMLISDCPYRNFAPQRQSFSKSTFATFPASLVCLRGAVSSRSYRPSFFTTCPIERTSVFGQFSVGSIYPSR